MQTERFESVGSRRHSSAVPAAQLNKKNSGAYLLDNRAQPVQRKTNSTGLPDNLKSGIENLSGHSMDDVKVHYNSSQPAQLNAHAYAQGNQIHVASGQEKHLAHEAWHVVQQKQGRVKPTVQLKGKYINDNRGLEKEADEMGAKAMAGGAQTKHTAQLKTSRSHSPDMIVQRMVFHDAPDYQPKNNRAGSVSVENIRGSPYGPGANAPSVNVTGWPELIASGDTLGNPNSTHYNAVRMHLWNGRLGGPGNDPNNLAPGPAQINSSMSAGPEDAAKDAVANGSYIWLETEVWYQTNAVNANDFTSVIPNRMRMQWGLMYTANGNAPGAFNPGTVRGPALPPHWDVAIDQPAGAMTLARQQQYTAVASTAALDLLLAGTSDQEKAQAYALVNAGFQMHMLLTQPSIYMGMDDATQALTLAGLTVAQIQTLMGLLGLADNRRIYNEVLVHLQGTPPLLQGLFQTFAPADQIAQIRISGGDLLNHLGAVGSAIARVNKPTFNLLSYADQNTLLNTMNAAAIAALLHNAIDTPLLTRWARSQGHNDPSSMSIFMTLKLTPAMSASFDVQMDWLRRQQRARQNPHPARNRRPPGWPY